MKKIIYTFLLAFALLLTISPVHAEEENKLYFTNSGNRLYYDSKQYNDEYFLSHLKMIPGTSYEDKLVIENDTEYDYKLYMKVRNANQSELAKELLQNIKMDIYLDGELLYSGYTDGLDYSHNGVDLTNLVYIGEYKSHTRGEIVVKTKLSEEYSNIENRERATFEWEFMAEYNDLVLPINPDTSKDSPKYIKIGIILISILFLFILISTFGIERRKLVIKKL